MTDKPTRRDLMKPLHLVGIALGAGLFAGIVTLLAMGFFAQLPADQTMRALMVALIAAGVTFIGTLVVMSLLLLAVDPAQVTQAVDRPVLLPPVDDDDREDGPADSAGR